MADEISSFGSGHLDWEILDLDRLGVRLVLDDTSCFAPMGDSFF